jgi:hypothetical protein
MPPRYAAAGLMLFAAAALSAACRKVPTAEAEPDRSACTGEPPACYTPLADGCCGDTAQKAECGPLDAPVGTHLRWICPGETTIASSCRGIGSACVPRTTGHDPTNVPHAVLPLVTTDMVGGADAGKPARGKADKGKRRH